MHYKSQIAIDSIERNSMQFNFIVEQTILLNRVLEIWDISDTKTYVKDRKYYRYIILFSVSVSGFKKIVFLHSRLVPTAYAHWTDLVAISCKRILKKVVPNSRFGAANRYNTQRACNIAYTVRQGHRGLLRYRRRGAFH